jgi:nonribosomal peptide synthetase DhbF
VGIHDNFFELGGHSLGAMRLINACNTHFGVSLPIHTLFQCPTIGQLGAAIEGTLAHGGQLSGGRHGHLLPLQPKGTKRKLFCIHPAGGASFCYLPLAQSLGQDQPLFALQASGLEAGESLPGSVEEAATEYVASIRQEQAEGPYQLLGMSTGGLIALEMAKQLKEGGHDVGLLVLLDTTVPVAGAQTELSSRMLLETMAFELLCGDLLERPDAPQNLAELVAMGMKLGRLPAGFTLAQAERIAAVFQNSVRMHFAYRPQRSSFGEHAVLMRALQRDHEGDKAPDWHPYIDNLTVVDVDCRHTEILSPTMVKKTTALLAPYLK